MKKKKKTILLMSILLAVLILISACLSIGYWYTHYYPVKIPPAEDFDVERFSTWFDWNPEKRPNIGNARLLREDMPMEEVVAIMGKPHYLMFYASKFLVIWDLDGEQCVVAEMDSVVTCRVNEDRLILKDYSLDEFIEHTIAFCNEIAESEAQK